MNENRIKELITRYYEGATSLDEELELTRFFSQENVPEVWHTEQELFLKMANERDALCPTPKGLEERLNNLINQWSAEENKTYPIPSDKRRKLNGNTPLKVLPHKVGSNKSRLWWIVGTAACLLIAGGIGLTRIESETDVAPVPPEVAYAETERALLMFSKTLNKGVEQMNMAQQTTQQIKMTINQTLNRIN